MDVGCPSGRPFLPFERKIARGFMITGPKCCAIATRRDTRPDTKESQTDQGSPNRDPKVTYTCDNVISPRKAHKDNRSGSGYYPGRPENNCQTDKEEAGDTRQEGNQATRQRRAGTRRGLRCGPILGRCSE